MEFWTGFSSIILYILVFIFVKYITIYIHELGHAIFSLFYMDDPVGIYVGSYGDPNTSLNFQTGRLSHHISTNIISIVGGLCYHSKPETKSQELIIVLMGPIFSLLIFIFPLIAIKQSLITSDLTISLAVIISISGLWDFIVNIRSDSKPTFLHNNNAIYNDGFVIQTLIKELRIPKEHQEVLNFSNSLTHVEAIQDILDTTNVHKNKPIFLKLVKIYEENGQQEAAIKAYFNYLEIKHWTHQDYAKVGTLYYQNNNFLDAIEFLNKSIYYDYENSKNLTTRGKCYLELVEPERAYNDFESALYHNGTAIENLLLMSKCLRKMHRNEDATELENRYNKLLEQ